VCSFFVYIEEGLWSGGGVRLKAHANEEMASARSDIKDDGALILASEPHDKETSAGSSQGRNNGNGTQDAV
jgi:hypothetical protein